MTTSEPIDVTTVEDARRRVVNPRTGHVEDGGPLEHGPIVVPRVEANDERWSVWLDPATTLLETVALMSGLRLIGVPVEAHNVGDGVFALTPLTPHREPPSAYELLQCMRLGARVPQAAPRLRFVVP